ncbi:hypothetical protein PQR68_34475 [Paraburkholderia agricolaris]|uniref:OmpW/AlkL family protein n=1 Tax=Paraburkholderia agricolaris TaxID=2152888 RepID=UPI0038BA4556
MLNRSLLAAAMLLAGLVFSLPSEAESISDYVGNLEAGGASSLNVLSWANVYATVGWQHIQPTGQSGSLASSIPFAGTVINQDDPKSALAADSSDTPDLSVGYFFTPHIAAELSAGLPTKLDLQGKGDMSYLGTVGSAHIFAPTLMLKYFFNEPEGLLNESSSLISLPYGLRPFLGIGVSHVSFSDAKFGNAALLGDHTMSIRDAWEPVFALGATYTLSEHWFVMASVSYMPLHPVATINANEQMAIGSVHTQTTTRLHINPIVSQLSIGYKF